MPTKNTKVQIVNQLETQFNFDRIIVYRNHSVNTILVYNVQFLYIKYKNGTKLMRVATFCEVRELWSFRNQFLYGCVMCHALYHTY